MHGWVDIGGWGRCTQAPCLFVHLSVRGVIATGVTPGPMSLCTFVGVWSHCYWCDTRCHVCTFVSVWSHCYWCDIKCHVCLYVCLSVCAVIAIGVTPGAMSVRLFVSVWCRAVCVFVCQCVESLLSV